MTDQQALQLRASIVKALAESLGVGEIAFVIVLQHQGTGKLDVLTNAAHPDFVPELLRAAAGRRHQ